MYLIAVHLIKELAKFAISVLILSHSNAEVERIFSQLNVMKSKRRNRMETKMAIVTVIVICARL